VASWTSRFDDEDLQVVEVGKQKPEGARRVFAEAVKKPPVGFGDHRKRRAPSARRRGEEARGFGVVAIGSVEKRDEDARIEENRARAHGRARL
jgi:hypothetical protein